MSVTLDSTTLTSRVLRCYLHFHWSLLHHPQGTNMASISYLKGRKGLFNRGHCESMCIHVRYCVRLNTEAFRQRYVCDFTGSTQCLSSLYHSTVTSPIITEGQWVTELQFTPCRLSFTPSSTERSNTQRTGANNAWQIEVTPGLSDWDQYWLISSVLVAGIFWSFFFLSQLWWHLQISASLLPSPSLWWFQWCGMWMLMQGG